jgi:phosphatidylglycerol lysyltransferase
VLKDEVDVRKFFLCAPAGEPVALVSFDPIYRAGQVIGYSPAIKRRLPDAPLRAEEGIMKHAIECFQVEGRELVMLGLSPMAGIRDQEFRANRLQHWGWSRALEAWWVNRFFYNLAGHADFKRRFGGLEEQTYFASDCLLNDFRVVATLRMAGAL